MHWFARRVTAGVSGKCNPTPTLDEMIDDLRQAWKFAREGWRAGGMGQEASLRGDFRPPAGRPLIGPAFPLTVSIIACRTKTRLAQNVLQNKATPRGWCGFRDASSSGMVKTAGPMESVPARKNLRRCAEL